MSADHIKNLRDALVAARKQLVTLGGEAKTGTPAEGCYDDQIQAAVLEVIDEALAVTNEK